MSTRVAFIGAGAVNFGLGNAWDHASRLEKMDVTFVGVSDPFVTQAEKVIALRKQEANKNRHKWMDIKIFADYKEMLSATNPDCVFIGVPPNAHGSGEKPLELECINANAHVFIEKPISCTPPEKMAPFKEQLCAHESSGTILSVAYMFRYSKAIQEVKKLVEMFGPVKLINARYNCAYSTISKMSWWDNTQSGGPIVEQATHFVDIARYIAGEIKLDSIRAMSIKSTDPAGELCKLPVNEQSIPAEQRVPRVTTAMWSFASGAVGTLTHSVLLHGWSYDTQLEVCGDGYSIILKDPYDKNEITFRAPGDEVPRTMTVPNDPYWEEIETFIDAVKSKNSEKIKSSYSDAFKTYEATWAIRRAAEATCI
jgi:predicted dehydrogenase